MPEVEDFSIYETLFRILDDVVPPLKEDMEDPQKLPPKRLSNIDVENGTPEKRRSRKRKRMSSMDVEDGSQDLAVSPKAPMEDASPILSKPSEAQSVCPNPHSALPVRNKQNYPLLLASAQPSEGFPINRNNQCEEGSALEIRGKNAKRMRTEQILSWRWKILPPSTPEVQMLVKVKRERGIPLQSVPKSEPSVKVKRESFE
jgi:hypothetical protein